LHFCDLSAERLNLFQKLSDSLWNGVVTEESPTGEIGTVTGARTGQLIENQADVLIHERQPDSGADGLAFMVLPRQSHKFILYIGSRHRLAVDCFLYIRAEPVHIHTARVPFTLGRTGPFFMTDHPGRVVSELPQDCSGTPYVRVVLRGTPALSPVILRLDADSVVIRIVAGKSRP